MDDLRDRMLTFLHDEPGANTTRIATAFGIDLSTATYHLGRLARHAQANREEVGRDVCWFPARGFCPVLRRAIPVLRRDDARLVTLALDDAPRSSAGLALDTGLSRGKVRWIVASLQSMGIAQRSAHGRSVLARGADVCVTRAALRERCDLWGTCPVSKAYEARLAASARVRRERPSKER